MDANKDNEAFIKLCLSNLDSFLEKQVFKNGLRLNEENKGLFAAFAKAFAICEAYLHKADEPLQLNLKKKLANLPIEKRKRNYPTTYLSKSEQLNILIGHFGNLETKNFNQFILEEFSDRDRLAIAKLAAAHSPLASHLQTLLRKKIGENIDWTNKEAVLAAVEAKCSFDVAPSKHLKSLRRAIKAKNYFLKQKGNRDNEINIPMWYHATKVEAVSKIISAQAIRVMKKRKFKGAWFSSVPDVEYRETYGKSGDWVFSLSSRILKMSKKPTIEYQFNDRRWRATQTDIPVCKSDTRYVTYISVPSSNNKAERNNEKRRARSFLRKQNAEDVMVISQDQLQYMRNGIVSSLGMPNLNYNWWGK